MKVLAMYLPQFHRVEENDLWWGEGFTDWVSTQNAAPLYENHYQPHVPAEKKYYDLLQKDTFEWQAQLMNRFGIDGMCIYHYYFADGRKILEKPAEYLLEWKDINMPFCFCWANETWAKSWTKMNNVNVWNFEKNAKIENNDGILLLQNYGDLDVWKAHFNYLLTFFLDNRYIKINNKPVFVIYNVNDIACIHNMIDCWNEMAIEAGFSGIYVIGSLCSSKNRSIVDAELYMEPRKSLNSLKNKAEKKNGIRVIDYTKYWNVSLAFKNRIKTYYCGVVGFDDTPRRGEGGVVLENATPELFKYNLLKLFGKSADEENDFLFLNAWNEWGEGMHLEPDEKYGTAYLEAVSWVKNNEDLWIRNQVSSIDENDILNDKCEKFETYLNLLDKWMILREENIELGKRLLKRGIKKVIIYGWGIFGKHLYTELINSEIEIVGIVDANSSLISADVSVFSPKDTLPEFDTMIITAFHWWDSIISNYEGTNYKFMSIEEIICE